MRRSGAFRVVAIWFILLFNLSVRSELIRVATYNLENYLDRPTESRRRVKSPEARAKIRQSIRAIKPDVLALEEIGEPSALEELRAALRSEGLDFPFSEYVAAYDTNIHTAVLSRFPFSARRSHTNESILLDGRQFRIKRGFAELEVRVNAGFSFTLLVAHLKSRLQGPDADQAQQRLQEARVLRGIINGDFGRHPDLNLVVLGDFNDAPHSATLRTLIGRGRFKLVDTRPAERNGDDAPAENPRYQPARVTWTDYYNAQDSYSRIDYILLSPALARKWVKEQTYIPAVPNWGVGSDHRPIVAAFETATP